MKKLLKISNKNNLKHINIIRSIIIFITIILMNLNKSIYAINVNTFADSSKDLTGILLTIFIAIGIVLILLCFAIIIKINSLKKAADIINRYIEKWGMPQEQI